MKKVITFGSAKVLNNPISKASVAMMASWDEPKKVTCGPSCTSQNQNTYNKIILSVNHLQMATAGNSPVLTQHATHQLSVDTLTCNHAEF